MSETNAVERILTGKVVSNSRDKTIAVLVERKVRHPIYKKYIKRRLKYMHMMKRMSVVLVMSLEFLNQSRSQKQRTGPW